MLIAFVLLAAEPRPITSGQTVAKICSSVSRQADALCKAYALGVSDAAVSLKLVPTEKLICIKKPVDTARIEQNLRALAGKITADDSARLATAALIASYPCQ